MKFGILLYFFGEPIFRWGSQCFLLTELGQTIPNSVQILVTLVTIVSPVKHLEVAPSSVPLHHSCLFLKAVPVTFFVQQMMTKTTVR